MPAHSLDDIVTALVPSLAHSLAERFSVFRVMHHGTHEKQLSNVFAWLLRSEGTHELGDTFQRLLVGKVNRQLPPARNLPASGYRVAQEVETSSAEDVERDIADIVLTHERARIVVENFEWSDGHGHSYERYLAHGSRDGKQSVVVLLCVRHVSHLLRDGWENAVVLTYTDLLTALNEHVAGAAGWRRAHPRQHFFINELVQHYVEGPEVVSTEDQIRFLKAMCETGESARYGHRPQETAAQEFADLLALHAKRQFDEGRRTLAAVKRSLRHYAQSTLTDQLGATAAGRIEAVRTPFVGQWEWCVELRRADPQPDIFLEFGPTAVAENASVHRPLDAPDYGKVFVTRRRAGATDGIDRIVQTGVALDEVLNGLSTDDVRLRDAVVAVTLGEPD
ncbi:hypothetical protein FHE66_14515 [Georgenia sp. 311]|nr:hypothetical protein FHE66_14515 [Georgenia sp. 311]